MILVNKREKEAIMEKYPDTFCARTMRGDSKRHHYYVTESFNVMKLLSEMRGLNTTRKNKRKSW